MRVHVAMELAPAHHARLASISPQLTTGDRLPEEIDVLVQGVPSEEALHHLAPGGALVIPYSGLARTTRRRLAVRPDVRVYNLHHNAELVAEHAVAMLLAVTRGLLSHHAALATGDWRSRWAEDRSPSLHGQAAVILGMGAIGQRVGRALEALGMWVRGLRRSDGPDALDAALPVARAFVIAVPLTPETTGLIDATRLALLPPEAVLVNVARGPVCDEAALYEALRDRRLYGAGLDVWWRYPSAEQRHETPPSELPFHELDNVVLSPHRAGHGAETESRRIQHLAQLLDELVRGEEPASRVDTIQGY